jgi:hypothetical protein
VGDGRSTIDGARAKTEMGAVTPWNAVAAVCIVALAGFLQSGLAG